MSAAETAKAYKASVFGYMTGQTLDVRDYGSIEEWRVQWTLITNKTNYQMMN